MLTKQYQMDSTVVAHPVAVLHLLRIQHNTSEFAPALWVMHVHKELAVMSLVASSVPNGLKERPKTLNAQCILIVEQQSVMKKLYAPQAF